MRRRNGDHTSRAEDEALTLRLLDRICRFLPDFGLILENESILSQAAAQRPAEESLRPGQRWRCLAVMPVDDLKIIKRKQGEIYLPAVQMEHVAPQVICRLKRGTVTRQAEGLVFVRS